MNGWRNPGRPSVSYRREVIKGSSAIALLVAASCVPTPGLSGGTAAHEDVAPGARSSVAEARELDREGVRSYRAGRFTDAIAYFRAAHDLGGPSSELWNIVRCREGMDDLEGASSAIDEYLALRDLLAQDRADAQREAQALRARPSTLTVATTPPGALVTVDARAAQGSTPLTVQVRPGTHTLVVRRDGYSPVSQSVEARFGRAIIVTLDLERPRR
jgi:PEGA domain-containing protein